MIIGPILCDILAVFLIYYRKQTLAHPAIVCICIFRAVAFSRLLKFIAYFKRNSPSHRMSRKKWSRAMQSEFDQEPVSTTSNLLPHRREGDHKAGVPTSITQHRHGNIEIAMSGAVQPIDTGLLTHRYYLRCKMVTENNNVICNRGSSLDFDSRIQPWRLISGPSIPRWLFFNPERAANVLLSFLPSVDQPRQLEHYFTTKTGLCHVIKERQIARKAVVKRRGLSQSALRKLEKHIDDTTILALLRYGGTFPRYHGADSGFAADYCKACDVMYPEDLVPLCEFSSEDEESSHVREEYWKALFRQGADFWNSIPLFQGQHHEHNIATQMAAQEGVAPSNNGQEGTESSFRYPCPE